MSIKLWIPRAWRAPHIARFVNRQVIRSAHNHGRPNPSEKLEWISELLNTSEGGGYDLNKAGILGQTISWGEQDVFQHVNNVVYLKWFENARVNLFYNEADDHPELLDFFNPTKGVGPVIRSAEIAWRRPVVYPDRITVVHKVGPLEHPDRFVLYGVIISHNQKVVAARIKEVLVCIDEEGKKAPIPPKVRDTMQKWINEQDGS